MKKQLAFLLLALAFTVPAQAKTKACTDAEKAVTHFAPFFTQLFAIEKEAPPDMQAQELAYIGVLLKDNDAILAVCNVPGESAAHKAYLSALHKYGADSQTMADIVEQQMKLKQ